MTKKEYIDCISARLRHLPREDYDLARDYFLEYFDEAGAENEQQAIQDLGDPELAAQQIIMNLAIGNGFENVQENKKSVKKGFSAIWVGILAVFAAPIALPFAFAVVIFALAMLITAAAFILSIILIAVCFVACGVLGLIFGGILLFSAPFDGLATMGLGFLFMGISVLSILGCMKLWTLFVHGVTGLFGRMIKKRTVKASEEKQR